MSIPHPNVRDYLVLVNTEEEDPLPFGPYTERKARELADRFNDKIEEGLFEGEGWIHATVRQIDNPQTVRGMLAQFGK